MKKTVLIIISLFLMQATCLAEESVSYAISITIPEIIEHSQFISIAENTEQTEDEKTKDTKPYPWQEYVVIVKTIITEP